MEKKLRKRRTPAIVLSDSDSNIIQISSDEEYIPEKKKPKMKVQRTKVKEERTKVKGIKKESRRSEDIKNVKTEKLKSTKRQSNDPYGADIPKKKIKSEIQDNNNLNNIKKETQDLDEDKKWNVKAESSMVECSEWTEVEYVSEINNIDKQIAENVVKLFNEDNTIPFIARYRKFMTAGMEADQLRMLKESFDQAKMIKQRAGTIIKSIDKLKKWTPEIHSIIKSTKSLDDLEHIYSFFKPASKRSLAERAKELGLGPVSEAALHGQSLPHLSSFINVEKEGLKNVEEIKDGIIHIIADIINKDKVIFDKVKTLQENRFIEIQTTQSKSTEGKGKIKEQEKGKKKTVDESKYKNYFEFKGNVRNIKPHQILAINRGEAQKILNVKILIPNSLESSFKMFCSQQYKNAIKASNFHSALLNDSIDYAYKKFIKPLVVRRVRSAMKEKAETASIEVFVSNVKQLLLTPPIRGKVVLGVDPGFYHGCKLAVVSEHGSVLDTAVIYPHKNTKESQERSSKTLINLVKEYNVTVVALGNATACRETEMFITKLIEKRAFAPENVSYTIVDESGASIYSCSAEAKSEFPDMDPNIISAISIARRLQDPLAELVKVEPKHLGVGMYQHDLPEKQLMLSLNEVVSEAVSFVGVDINTASHCLLRRVAGLNVSKATNIMEHKSKHGPFTNREQLLEVKGIGNKTYEQCVGFIRILPETALNGTNEKKLKGSKKINFLDQTWIHPESYKVAKEFLKYCKCNVEELGSAAFIEQIKSKAKAGSAVLAKQFNTNETTMDIIIKGLTMKKDEDIRLKENYPLFRNAMQSIDDLKTGMILSGVVRNVTHFGAFVDAGVGRDGLIHVKWMKNETLSIGQRVEVKVIGIERERQRISFELIKTM